MEHINDPRIAKLLREKFIREIREYARGRQDDIARGAETPEMASLLIDKSGLGMMKAAQLLEFRVDGFSEELDRIVREIDPDFLDNQKKRWAARPAALTYGEN